MVYLPTCTIKINHSWIGKYTSSSHGWYGYGVDGFPPSNARQDAKTKTDLFNKMKLWTVPRALAAAEKRCHEGGLTSGRWKFWDQR